MKLLGLKSIPFDSLVLSPFNIRKAFRRTNLEWLIQSIKNVNIDLPLLVRRKGDKYEVVVGQRRYIALKGLRDYENHKIEEVPCIVAELTDQETERLSARESLLTEFVSGRDKAKIVNKVLEEVGSLKEVEKVLGIPEKVIEGYLRDLHTNPTEDYQKSVTENVEEILRKTYKGEEEEKEKQLEVLQKEALRAISKISFERLRELKINTERYKNRLDSLKSLVKTNPSKVISSVKSLQYQIDRTIEEEEERLRSIQTVPLKPKITPVPPQIPQKPEGDKKPTPPVAPPQAPPQPPQQPQQKLKIQTQLQVPTMPMTIMNIISYLSKSPDPRFDKKYSSKEPSRLRTEQDVISAFHTMASDLVTVGADVKMNFFKAKCIILTEALKEYLDKHKYYYMGS